MNKIIGIIICLAIVFSATSTSSAVIIGNTSYGYVEKFTYGNQTSDITITYITGVHPLEKEFSFDVANTVKNKSSSLRWRYIVYKVHVTKSTSDYTQSRINGQNLAQKFVVPSVIKSHPTFVFDIHENYFGQNNYKYPRFLYPISQDAYTFGIVRSMIYRIPFLVIYYPPNPTSVQYVTQPIANQGIPTVIYETNKFDSSTKKVSDARLFVNVTDNTLF